MQPVDLDADEVAAVVAYLRATFNWECRGPAPRWPTCPDSVIHLRLAFPAVLIAALVACASTPMAVGDFDDDDFAGDGVGGRTAGRRGWWGRYVGW